MINCQPTNNGSKLKFNPDTLSGYGIRSCSPHRREFARIIPNTLEAEYLRRFAFHQPIIEVY